MKPNLEDFFAGLEIEDEPKLRLTDAEPVEHDVLDTVIEDPSPLLKLAQRWDDERAMERDMGAAATDEIPQDSLSITSAFGLQSRLGGSGTSLALDADDIAHPVGLSHANRPSILHVRVVCGTGGGPEKTILRSPRYANDEYFRMAVAYIHPRGDKGIETIKANAKKLGAPLFTIPERGPVDLRTVRALYQLCKSQNVAVWHGHDYKSNLLGLMLRKFWKMKLVTTVHGWTNDTWRTRLYYHVDKYCLPRYDEVIAVSPLLHEQCLNIGVPQKKLTYICNAIDCGEFQRTRSIRQARSELGVYRDTIMMGVVGRLSPEKGVDRAIRTVADLHTKYPNLELHLIGDGPEYEKLKALAVELGVASIVHFWGFQGDSKRFFEMFDFLLLPSHTEGFPNVVLEAMAMGVPVAAADVGGVSELLKYGRRGVVLEPRDQETWASQIAPLIVSEDRRAELSRQGRRRVEKYYSFDKRMEKVFKVYDRVLSIESRREKSEWRRAA